MHREYLIILLWYSALSLAAQNPNDNCENATDITSEIFKFDNWDNCNSAIGTTHIGHGLVSDEIDQATVDALVYSSQSCTGYTSQTTDHYPDVWYKTTLQLGEEIRYWQNVFLNAGDTVQVALYYGQCGSLFQSQCFTLTYNDSLYWQGLWIEYHPHNQGDDMFIQLKVPPSYQDQVEMCFSTGQFGIAYYYFSYERPAHMNGISQTGINRTSVPIMIYPNPTNATLHVRSDFAIQSYTITDLQGKVWNIGGAEEKMLSLSMHNLPAGMYIIRVQTEDGMGMSKYYKE